jgi:hypothetical protein
MASTEDINSTLQGIVRNLSQWNQNLLKVFPRINGSFKLSAAVTTVVAQASVAANANIQITATNAAAAAQPIYVSAIVSGVSFSVSTTGGAAAGTETYNYLVLNPS